MTLKQWSMTIVLALVALSAAGWAAAWPLDVAPPVTPAVTQTPAPVPAMPPQLPTLGELSMLWSRSWQGWEARPVNSATKQATPAVAALPPKLLNVRYLGVILEEGRPYGYFSTPEGHRIAAPGQRIGPADDAPQVVRLEPQLAVVRDGGAEHTLNRHVDGSTPPSTTPAAAAPAEPMGEP